MQRNFCFFFCLIYIAQFYIHCSEILILKNRRPFISLRRDIPHKLSELQIIMSFVTRIAAAPSAARLSSAQSAAVPALAVVARTRPFSTTAPYQKGPLQTGKDALKKVDRAVSDVAVKGLEKGGMFFQPFFLVTDIVEDICKGRMLIISPEQARDKIKDTVGVKGQEAQSQAEQLAGQAKGQAQKATAPAQEKMP